MNADWRGSEDNVGEDRVSIRPEWLKHAAVTDAIIRVFYEVYNALGHGFLESVYENAMEITMREAGLEVQRQVPIPVYFRGRLVGEFRADMFVQGRVILELKACRAIESSHEAQLLNYLRATEIEVGLLMNFGLKPEFKRMAFDNFRKLIATTPAVAPTSAL